MVRKKLKFVFIQPEFPKRYFSFFPIYEPLHGLLFGAIARDLADTVIFDRRFETDESLARLIRELKPDIVGATTHVGAELFNVKRLFSIVKKIHPDALTIVGGQHSTLLPEDLFDDSVDLVCIGPGEETFREVVETRISGGDYTNVSGLAVRQGDAYVITPQRVPKSRTIISWPRFDRSLVTRYKKHYYFRFEILRPTVYTITSSGCPHRCKFCSLWAASGGVYRVRKPEEVVDDIISQPQTYVHITDDNTFYNEENALEVYRLLKKTGVKKKILAYARADTVVQKTHILEKWREIGLAALVLGVEACSDEHLQYLNKKTSVDVNIHAHRILESLGIENWAHFVIMPNFQKEDFERVWNFVDRLNMTYPLFIPLTPVPGTPLFFESKAKGNLSVFDYGFYNLQYMALKTTLPKREWYNYMKMLYHRSCSLGTLWRRRASPSFHWRPAVGRAIAMGSAPYRGEPHIKVQLEIERTVRYEDIEPTLLPSFRKDYKLDKYYHAATLACLKEEGIVL